MVACDTFRAGAIEQLRTHAQVCFVYACEYVRTLSRFLALRLLVFLCMTVATIVMLLVLRLMELLKQNEMV